MLITAKSGKGWNTMTASWGGMGVLWGKNVMFLFVRRSRYTHEFLEDGNTFTCSFFPEQQQKALAYLGSHSGRDEDKVKASALVPKLLGDEYVSFEEANLVFACKKIGKTDMVPDHFAMPEDILGEIYSDKDWHTLYVGAIDKVYVRQ